MVYKDYYKILDLETSRVSIEEVKLAYRAAVKKYHPDVNVRDELAEERIKDINEAYRKLSTPSSKRKYDRAWNSKNNVKNYKNIKSDTIFNMFLGDLKNQKENKDKTKNPIKGENIETEINVSIYDAFYGLDKKISLKTIDGNSKTYSVTVPQGIQNGAKIRLIGQGKPGENGGKNGDLFIKINIDNDKDFKLDGNDLHTTLYLTPWDAALGARVSVKTIDENAQVYIPQGIESGEIIKIPNKGYRNGKGERGDLVANVKINVPKKLTEQEQKLFEKLRQISKFNPRS